MFDTLEYVNKNSDYVSVNERAIAEFVRNRGDWEYHYWLTDLKNSLSEKQRIIFAFVCESINFCFWKNEKYNKDYIGSETIFSRMKEASLKNPQILDVEWLAGIDETQFNNFFGKSQNEIPLMKKRYNIFKQTVATIQSKDKEFWDELYSFQKDLDLLNYLTKTFPAFEDKSMYKEKKIYFNKKANLLVNDLFWLSDRIEKNLGNLDSLTGGADYAVPRVLLENQILVYNDELLRIVKSKKLIPHDSSMEIEIRANTLYVIEKMKKLLQEQGLKINSIQLDNVIWCKRNNIEHTIPVHRTETTCY